MELAQGTIEKDAHEAGELVRDYFARTIASKGMSPLKFKWPVYEELERVGACKIYTARDYDKLIGFVLYIIQEHLHHDNQRIAQCDMIGVRPEHRNKGVGRMLVSFAEEKLKEHGATHIVHHHRTIYKVTPLFEDMGFKLVELGYVKEL